MLIFLHLIALAHMIDNKPLLNLLPGHLAEVLTGGGTRQTFHDGQSIHLRGDDKPSLSVILSGRVRFGLYTGDGNYIQTGVLGKGHCFGEATLFLNTPRPYYADAIAQTELVDIKKTTLHRLLEAHPALAAPLLTTLTNRLYESLEFADDLRSNALDVRIAKQLLRLNASGDFAGNAVEIRQADIAYGLGQSRVSVSKALAHLKAQGLIRLGYREIEIPDPEALAAWTRRHDLARR